MKSAAGIPSLFGQHEVVIYIIGSHRYLSWDAWGPWAIDGTFFFSVFWICFLTYITCALALLTKPQVPLERDITGFGVSEHNTE